MRPSFFICEKKIESFQMLVEKAACNRGGLALKSDVISFRRGATMSEDKPRIFARAASEALTREITPPRIREAVKDGAPAWFSVFDPIISTSEICFAAGVETATFMSWRRKFRMFRWTPEERRGSGNSWSIIDALMLRLASIMIEHGVEPRDALWFVGSEIEETPKELALGVIANIAAAIANPHVPHIVAFHSGGTVDYRGDRVSFHRLDPDQSIAEALARIKSVALVDTIVVTDIRDIVARVQMTLGVELRMIDTTPMGNA